MIKIQMEDLGSLTCSKYSRKLLKQGVDPKEKVEIYRGDLLCLTIKEIGLMAQLDIRENDKIGPIYVKHKPMSEEALKILRGKVRPHTRPCV